VFAFVAAVDLALRARVVTAARAAAGMIARFEGRIVKTTRSFCTRVAALAPLAAGIACVPQPPRPETAAVIGRATDLPDAIAWHADAEPLDADDWSDELTSTAAARLALRHDASLQAALTRVRIAAADAEQVRLWPNPVLSLAVRPLAGGGAARIEASLSADLLAILQRPRRAGAADARLRAASADALTAALDALAAARVAHADAAALDEAASVLRERQALVERLLGLARARVEAGESSRLDVLTLDGERLSLAVQVAENDADRRVARLLLARLIGRPSDEAAWRLVPDATDPTLIDANAAVLAALEHRPEILSGRWQLAALGEDRALSGWNVFDGLTVGVDSERDEAWSVGPSLNTPLPIFDTGRVRQKRASLAVIEARHTLRQTQRQVVQEVRQSLESLRRLEAVLGTAVNELVPLQQERIEQADAAYRNGLADATALLIAQQESQAARQKVIELQQRVAIARARFDRAVGGAGVSRAATRPAEEKPL
jgi:outer membrane protein, heavy metal efflux system